MISLDSKIPEGPIADKWTNHKFNMKLVNPANKRKYKAIVVGSGLAGGAAAGRSPWSFRPVKSEPLTARSFWQTCQKNFRNNNTYTRFSTTIERGFCRHT